MGSESNLLKLLEMEVCQKGVPTPRDSMRAAMKAIKLWYDYGDNKDSDIRNIIHNLYMLNLYHTYI